MDSQSVVNTNGFFEKIKVKFENFWSSLSESQQSIFQKVGQILTYKWKWQIALNSPFLIIWILDKNIPSVHQFEIQILQSLPIPEWSYSFM
tara:strand:+ start:341 stop:613 length:273 start_codon:yes stop_codon:yes gene_type:complete